MSAVAVAAIASVGIGAATAAGAFTPNAPAQPSVAQMTGDQVKGLVMSTPENYAAQAQYSPLFAGLNSSLAWQNLFGSPASSTVSKAPAAYAGWYDSTGKYLGPSNLYSSQSAPAGAKNYAKGASVPTTTTVAAAPGELTTAAAAQPALLAMQSQSRGQDIADVATLGPAAHAAIAGYDPAVTNLYGAMDQQAQDLVNQNGALDPFTQTALQQSYRAGEAARGMAGGTSDAAMEAYYQAATQEQRRLTNLNVAGQVAGETAGYYGDPFQQVLGRTSGGVQTPGVPYSSTGGSVLGNTASLLNNGQTDVQGMGYQAQVGTQNAAYMQQQQGLASLITPGTNGSSTLTNGVSALLGYQGF